MFKFVTIYRRVDNEDVLEKFFAGTHLKLSEQLPGLIKSEVSRVNGKPGGESRFHLMYELYFESADSFETAIATPVGIKLIQALKHWADVKIVTWFFSESFEEETARAEAHHDE
jgi:uncharacterized protein (TIGR02118 family)